MSPFVIEKGSTAPNISNKPAINTRAAVIIPNSANDLGTKPVLKKVNNYT
ncbi:hypothetical protein GCM10020331_013810 [Ectobacillus funiculus]